MRREERESPWQIGAQLKSDVRLRLRNLSRGSRRISLGCLAEQQLSICNSKIKERPPQGGLSL